jgi:FdhE protein
VAETFLRRWFGGKPTASAADEARAEIDRLLADRPSYSGPLTWLRAVTDELTPVAGYIAATLPEPEAARDKLAAGEPLLRGLGVVVEDRQFARRWKRLCEALNESQPGAASPALSKVVRKQLLDGSEVLSALLRNDPRPIADVARKTESDPGLVSILVRLTLFPGMATVQETAASPLRGVAWDRGHCPVCGGPPLLGEFRGLDQSRFLRCGLCAASWEVPRQWCPACGNRDHESLGFLAKEGEESRYRVATCDTCRSGVKMLSTLSALPPLMLLVADAATLHLDLAAADHGYLCPPPSAHWPECR